MPKIDIFKKSKEKIRFLLLNRVFQEQIKKLREKWGVSLEGFQNDQDRKWKEELYKDDDKVFKFLKDMNELKGRHKKFDDTFDLFFRHYFLTNEVKFVPSSIPIINIKNWKTKELFIKDNDDVTFFELKEARKYAKLIRNNGELKKFKRYKTLFDFDLQEEIYKLFLGGFSDREIAEIINKNSTKKYTQFDVNKIRQRFIKKIKDT